MSIYVGRFMMPIMNGDREFGVGSLLSATRFIMSLSTLGENTMGEKKTNYVWKGERVWKS